MLDQSVRGAAVAVLLAVAVAAQGFQLMAAPLGLHGIPLSNGALGTGICAADFDGDGDLDVVIAGAPGTACKLFRNDGGMQFTDVTVGSGLGACAEVLCMAAADIDNDGDADLFVGNRFSVGKLFINQGGAVFTEQGHGRGIDNFNENYAVCFGDFDRDGWLDLYLGNRRGFGSSLPAANILYRNVGGGYFVDATATAGVGGNRLTLVSTWLDYNEDGWPDLLEVNDKGNQWGGNELYRNNGNGTFTAVGAALGAAIAIDGMGVDHLDVFNDGGLDFYCTDVPLDHLFQLWDPGAASYLNATGTYGLQGGGVGWACKFFDYDNDGWQDLHVVQMQAPNLLFRNPGAPAAANVAWPDVAPAIGLNHFLWQYTNAVGDFDDDGRIDLLERFNTGLIVAPDGVGLYRNTVAGGNWLKFRTRGVVSNRDGLGARIEVITPNLHQRQWVRSGTGYLSNSDPRVHFGLGTAVAADLVRVTWPLGQVQYLSNVAANQIVELVEPSMRLTAPATIGGTTTLAMSIPGDEGLSYLMVLSLSNASSVLPGGIVLPVGIDVLTSLTMVPGNPILPGAAGVLDAMGQASSSLTIPPLPWLAGLTMYATGMTADAPRFPVLRTVFPTAVAITIQ